MGALKANDVCRPPALWDFNPLAPLKQPTHARDQPAWAEYIESLGYDREPEFLAPRDKNSVDVYGAAERRSPLYPYLVTLEIGRSAESIFVADLPSLVQLIGILSLWITNSIQISKQIEDEQREAAHNFSEIRDRVT